MQPEAGKLLWDMLDAAKRIERFTRGKSYEDYLRDELLRSGVERQYAIIGEAMSRLIGTAPEVARKISDHRKISRFRNVLIHAYDQVDDTISWGIVQEKLPVLQQELEQLLHDSGNGDVTGVG